MTPTHKTLTPERWASFSLAAQLMNIDTEPARAQSMRQTGDEHLAQQSFARAIELVNLTVTVQHNQYRRRELTRLRELITGVADNRQQYHVTLGDIRKPLEPFSVMVARERGV